MILPQNNLINWKTTTFNHMLVIIQPLCIRGSWPCGKIICCSQLSYLIYYSHTLWQKISDFFYNSYLIKENIDFSMTLNIFYEKYKNCIELLCKLSDFYSMNRMWQLRAWLLSWVFKLNNNRFSAFMNYQKQSSLSIYDILIW